MSKQQRQLTNQQPEKNDSVETMPPVKSAEAILAGLEAKVGVARTRKAKTRRRVKTSPEVMANPDVTDVIDIKEAVGSSINAVMEDAASVESKPSSDEIHNTAETTQTEPSSAVETSESDAHDMNTPEANATEMVEPEESVSEDGSSESNEEALPEIKIPTGEEEREIFFPEDEFEEDDEPPAIIIKLKSLKNKLLSKLKKQPDSESDENLSEEGFNVDDITVDTVMNEDASDKEFTENELDTAPENMTLFEKISYYTRMRRREHTRQRRENARRNGNMLDLPYQPMTMLDIRSELIRLGVACAFLIFGYALKKSSAGTTFSVIAYIIAMLPILVKVVQNFTQGSYFDENIMTLIASFGALLLGAREEAAVVLILHGIGKMASDFVLVSTHKSLTRPINFLPDLSSVVNMQGEERRVAPADIEPDEFILVRSGERIPIDCVVLRGEGTVDDSALTGNAEPMEITKGSKVLAGGLYEGSLLLLRSVAKLDDCAVSRVLRVQEAAPGRKAGLETNVLEGSRKFIPIIACLAVLLAVLPPLFHSDTSLSNWAYRALTILLVCCPSVLTIAVPLSFTSCIGHLAQRGVHSKGSSTVEKMAELRMIVFNKTGTLTEGNLNIKDIQPAHDFTQEACLSLAAAAEQKSHHPIAKAIVSAYKGKPKKITEFEEYPGRGIRARLGNSSLLVGSRRLMISRGVKGVPEIRGTVVYVAYEGDYAGAIIFEDKVRQEAAKAIEDLKALGVLRTVLLSGDTEAPAQRVADAVGVDTVHSGLLPDERSSKMEFLLRTIPTDGTSGYIGNGIDDFDELKQADVGIVMGIAGSEETASAADMLVMTNDLSRIPEAVHLCRKAHGIALQNMALAILTKIVLAILALVGAASMWQAVSADVLVTVLTVLNAARIIGGK